jgi:hypothetical protein
MANVQANQRYNAVRTAGNNVEWFEKAKKIIAVNDGKRNQGQVVSYCHDQQAPFPFEDKTQVEITSASWDVTNIRKCFISCRATYDIQIAGLTAAGFTDADHLGKLFIGYKASCQAVHRMALYYKGAATAYQNEYITQEGVAFANTRPFTAKDKKRFIYTLYENASRYMPDICGTYVNLIDFIDGNAHPVTFDFNIPVVDFLLLQCFDKWIKEFGKLTLEMYLSRHALVVCSVNPKDVLENKQFLQTDTINYSTLAGNFAGHEHRFTQVGDQFTGFTLIANTGTAGSGTTTFTPGFLRVTCPNARCIHLNTTIRGYSITDSAKNQILDLVEPDGLIIPCQQMVWKQFPTPPNDNGIDATLDIPYDNITAAVVVFPKTAKQRTVFENPMLDGLYLQVDSLKIPNIAYDTTGARYLQEQLILNDLDGNLQATAEFTNSIVNERNAPNGARYLNCLSDDTAMMATFQLERGDSGYVFDGYVSNGSVNTLIHGDSRHKGPNNTYQYPFVNAAGQTILSQPNTNPPQLWLCHDTWCRVKEGVFEYHGKDAPPGSQTTG